MWVKICGNTRLEDCLAAAELGADAVGFVFAPGRRTVTAEQVAAITLRLPVQLEKIGVFLARDAEVIAETALASGLTGIQLHGLPDKVLLQRLQESSFTGKILQVLHWRTDVPAEAQRAGFAAQVERLNAWDLVDAVLVDSQTDAASGGTGTSFNWEAVAPLLSCARLPVVVAGGLRPETVAEAVRILRPRGVDVSSGVEAGRPGIKDRARIANFVAAARGLQTSG